MDSWKHLSDERGVWLSEELGFPADDGHGRFKSKEIGYEIKPFSNIEGCPLVSNTQALERLDFMDLGFSDEIRKSYSISTEPSGEVFSGEISTDSYGNLVSPFCEERESGSRFSTDFMQSNSQDFSLIDLKLGRLADGGGALGSSEPSPSSVSSLTGKRTRPTTLYPRSTCCQVLGCNKDLSSFKSYYKRHKVCDVHTKTAKVIVDGIEQRFCQQCSRFHLLAEFDDGKRSCRRRLAAHNKRRRKPQLNSEPGERMNHNVQACVKENIVSIGSLNVEQNSRALSLLSAPSDNTQFGAAITKLSSHADSHAAGHSAGFFRKITESGAHEPGIYAMEGHQVDPTTINPRDGSIILDLLQLSSHLQRIEQQRHSTESEAG